MQITCNTKPEIIDRLQYNGRRKLWQPEAQCNAMLETEIKISKRNIYTRPRSKIQC